MCPMSVRVHLKAFYDVCIYVDVRYKAELSDALVLNIFSVFR